MNSNRKKILNDADYLNKNALWCIEKILQKHSAAILEEMRDQLRARDQRIEELQTNIEELEHELNDARSGRMPIGGER